MKTTDTLTRGKHLVNANLRKMKGINKWQAGFISDIFLLNLSMGAFQFYANGTRRKI